MSDRGFIYVILVSYGSPFVSAIVIMECLFYLPAGKAPERHI
nr:MAG TPA: hypothetical protein [Caudoviricetes sp.]